MQFRPFTSIQVALGAYVYLFACPLPTFTNSMHAWMDGWMDGWTDTVDGWTYASTIICVLLLCETLGNLLFFFSREALLLRKALAQVFSILWPALLGG